MVDLCITYGDRAVEPELFCTKGSCQHLVRLGLKNVKNKNIDMNIWRKLSSWQNITCNSAIHALTISVSHQLPKYPKQKVFEWEHHRTRWLIFRQVCFPEGNQSGLKQCHVYHPWLGMATIPPIKKKMTGGWSVYVCMYTITISCLYPQHLHYYPYCYPLLVILYCISLPICYP